jgi:hypothetical protein
MQISTRYFQFGKSAGTVASNVRFICQKAYKEAVMTEKWSAKHEVLGMINPLLWCFANRRVKNYTNTGSEKLLE